MSGYCRNPVTSVAAHGKHLVIELEDGAYLRAHLGMNGRFRAYDRGRGEALLARMSPGRASLALVTDDGATCGSARRRSRSRTAVIRGTVPRSRRSAPTCWRMTSTAGSRRRVRRRRARAPIADVLLDQRVIAGIGNIYKTEALFAAGVDPRTRVDQLDAAALEAIYAAARRLMIASADAQRERSPLVPPQNAAPHQIYSRTGRPCPRCATPIDCYSLGEPPRWTWSCPRCQPPVRPAPAPAHT